jgi:hypothetical protein
MPTSQDCHVVIIGGPLAIRHRRAAKARKITMDIIADRAPLGAKPTSGSAARGRGFGEELPNNPEEREATIAAVHESVVGRDGHSRAFRATAKHCRECRQILTPSTS